MKTMLLILIFSALTFSQIKSLSETELKQELTRCLIERLGFKQQAELSDSLISELYKSRQREWIKDLELGACAEEKFALSQQLLNYECDKPPFYDAFAFGFLSTISLIILIYGGILIL